LALSYVCHTLCGRRVTLFLQKDRNQSAPISAVAEKEYQAKVYYFSKPLKEVQQLAEDYVNRENELGKGEIFLVPFGLDSEDYNLIFEKQLRKVIGDNINPKRIWMSVGSGTILRVLGKIWPETQFMPVQVGKKLYEDQYTPELWHRLGGKERIDQLTAPQRFFEAVSEDLRPPYPSVATYDAKVWQFILEYGEEGDYVWNVAKDIKT